jgi:hypothetical protein
MHEKWDFVSTLRPTVSIQCSVINQVVRHTRELMYQLLRHVDIEPIFLQSFITTVRVSMMSSMSIASILVNNIRFAKNSTVPQPACTCAEICEKLDLSKVEGGKHIATRASDIALPSAAKIFSIKAMLTLHPSSFEMDHWVTNKVITIYNQFKIWTGSRLSPTTCDKFEEIISDEAGKAAIPQWCCTQFISAIIDAASDIGLLPSSQVWQSIRKTMDIFSADLAQRLKKTQAKHPSMTDLTNLKVTVPLFPSLTEMLEVFSSNVLLITTLHCSNNS